MINVDTLQRNGKFYNGNTPKFGVIYNGEDYLVKLPKDGLSVYTEFIASNLIRSLGISCQQVYLGNSKGVIVNVIKDFTSVNVSLHSFKDTKQSSEDTDISTKQYTYRDVIYLIDKHIKLSEVEKIRAKEQFWDMFICDAILGNRDRHWGNWGYLAENGNYRVAPIYDNGSSLFPNVDRTIQEYLESSTRKQFMFDRIFKFPASLFMIEKPDRCYRTNYYEMFSDLRINKVFANRVKYFKNNISLSLLSSKCKVILDCSDLQNLPYYLKRFYMEIIVLRYACIVCRIDFDKIYNKIEEVLGNV